MVIRKEKSIVIDLAGPYQSVELSSNAIAQVVGSKAADLAKVPEAWRPVSVVLSSALVNQGQFSDETINAITGHLARYKELIVRSSGEVEDISRRGQFMSVDCPNDDSSLRKALGAVREDGLPRARSTNSAFAIIVQPRLTPVALGHLSNEYRHAQRVVDFLYESEVTAPPFGLQEGRTLGFRVARPVTAPKLRLPLRIRRGHAEKDLAQGLLSVGRWLARRKVRGHVEWVATADSLWIVQADEERDIQDVEPATAWKQLPAVSPKAPRLKCLRRIAGSKKDRRWRKTKSHEVFMQTDLYVPPIWILDNPSIIRQLQNGKVPPELTADLQKLLPPGLMLRVDVQVEDWPNLPTKGPVLDLKVAEDFILSAASQASARGIDETGVAIVLHQAIRAQCGAWSSGNPSSGQVRIDAIWGLPDGLQALPYDTYLVDVNIEKVRRHLRYKDEFIDSDPNSAYYSRKANQKRAQRPCLSPEQALSIARGTAKVVAWRKEPTNIMWFVGVERGLDRSGVMPWILTKNEDDGSQSFRAGNSDLEKALRRRLGLQNFRAITNSTDLIDFGNNPALFDVGEQHALFRPNADFLRDKQFIARVGDKLSQMEGWKLLLQGSLLAHAPYQLRNVGVRVVSILDYGRPPRIDRHRKLVRDKIPARIISSGDTPVTQTLDKSRFEKSLRLKAIEESLELLDATGRDATTEEMADVLAVLLDLAVVNGIAWREVSRAEVRKRRKRGGFKKRVFLHSSVPQSFQGHYPQKVLTDPAPGVRRLRNRTGVEISLIPPSLEAESEFLFRFGDATVRLRAHYRGKTVEIEFTDPHSKTTRSTQLSLWSDEEP